jgi:hypothetical protein
LIQNLHEEVYRLEVGKFIVVRVYTDAKEETRIPPVYNLGAALKLDEVGLIFLVSGSNEAVDL